MAVLHSINSARLVKIFALTALTLVIHLLPAFAQAPDAVFTYYSYLSDDSYVVVGSYEEELTGGGGPLSWVKRISGTAGSTSLSATSFSNMSSGPATT